MRPNGTAPPASRRRSMWVSVKPAIWSRSGKLASVKGQPATASSSFTAKWHAAERLRDVGISRCFVGPLGVEERERVEIAGLDGGESGVQLLEGTAFAGSEGVDEGDGIAGPRLRLAVIAHGSGP
ncbi:MAG: hypothetical protein V9G12_00760 [Microthrixaceae bacterium]